MIISVDPISVNGGWGSRQSITTKVEKVGHLKIKIFPQHGRTKQQVNGIQE